MLFLMQSSLFNIKMTTTHKSIQNKPLKLDSGTVRDLRQEITNCVYFNVNEEYLNFEKLTLKLELPQIMRV